MDAPDIPPPRHLHLHLKPTSVNQIQFISPTFSFLHPAHPHDKHTALFLVYNIITMHRLAMRCTLMATRGTIYKARWRQFVYIGIPVPCRGASDACTLSGSNAYLAFADLS